MATGVTTWSQTAASNGTADSSVNFAEGMAPSAVNDSARALMASVAEWRDDTNGTLASAGGTTAYTLTTNQTFAALAAGLHVVFQVNATNTGTTTLNVDSLGAKPLRVTAGAELVAGDIGINKTYRATYYTSNSGEWIIHSGVGSFVNVTATGSQFQTGVISPTQLTAGQDNYAPTGFASASVLRLDSNTAVIITGLAGGTAGRRITITNIGSFNITFASESASSTAANRIATVNSTNATIAPNATCDFWYDGTSSRWRPVRSMRAGEVVNAAAGGIAATDVQAAIDELDSEKAPKASPTFTGDTTVSQAMFLTGVITPTILGANTDDWAPTGFSTANVVRISASGAINLTGIAGGVSGRIIILTNVGSFTITLKHDTTSTAANRFQLNADTAVAGGQAVILIYDSGGRWKTVSL